jgi:hypothetical protein
MLGAEGGEQLGHAQGRKVDEDPDAQQALDATGRCALQSARRIDDLTSGLQQVLTGGRQRDAPAGAFDEPGSHPLFEGLDAGRHRRLHDVQASRGAREARLLGDGDEVLQQPRVHGDKLSMMSMNASIEFVGLDAPESAS